VKESSFRRDSVNIGALYIGLSLLTNVRRHNLKSRESEPMTEKDVEEALLEHAVKNGFLTFDELYEAFPAEYGDCGDLSDFLAFLDDLGINVVEIPEYISPKVHKRRAA
jgi:hypothetical protein